MNVNINLTKMNLNVSNRNILKKHVFQKAIKRVIEFVIAFICLTLALPIIALSCLAICFESKGSPIYKQVRYGWKGKEFTIYKLRTMYEHSSDGNLSAPQEGDIRVTKVGELLRKTSIDELPQLINVLKGDMSIVGPRAVPKEEIQLRLNKMIKNDPSKIQIYKRAMAIRSLSKPGMTGMAQAYGRSSLSVEEATAYDVYYTLNYSLTLDIKIIFKTLDTVIFQRGVN